MTTSLPFCWSVDPPVFGQCPDGGNQPIRACNAVVSHNEIAVASLAQQLRINWWCKATASTETHMFRAQIIQLANGPTLKMEGSLVGQWAEEAKSLVTNGPVPKGLVVDLTDVSYADSVGENVLAWFESVGASFMAKAVYAASLCERLQLPVHRKPPACRNKF